MVRSHNYIDLVSKVHYPAKLIDGDSRSMDRTDILSRPANSLTRCLWQSGDKLYQVDEMSGLD